jgi:hypothetical protein
VNQGCMEESLWRDPRTMRGAFMLAILLSFTSGCSKPQVAPSLTPKFEIVWNRIKRAIRLSPLVKAQRYLK